LRVTAARLALWSEVDLDAGLFTLPAARVGNKSRQPWVLPIPALGVDVLRSLEASRGASDGFAFICGQGDAAAASGDAQARLCTLSGVKGWSLNDLRRTLVSLAADADASLDVSAADLWLQHKPTGISAVYRRSARSEATAAVSRS
jgi:integrase